MAGDVPPLETTGAVPVTDVTVPLPPVGAEDTHPVPLEVRTFPEVPGAVRPVPPVAAGFATVALEKSGRMVLATVVATKPTISTMSPATHAAEKTTLRPSVAV